MKDLILGIIDALLSAFRSDDEQEQLESLLHAQRLLHDEVARRKFAKP